jgi:hypothetical protein
MAFIVQQRDAIGKAVLAQRHRKLKACMARADDDNRSCRHGNILRSSTRE